MIISRAFILRYAVLGLMLGVFACALLPIKDGRVATVESIKTLVNGYDLDFYPLTWNRSGRYESAFIAANFSSTASHQGVMNIAKPEAAAIPGIVQPQPSVPAESQQSPFYVRPGSDALLTAVAWDSSRPADAAIMRRIGGTPTAEWFGGWNSTLTADVDRLVTAATLAGKIPILVAYNIPNRDCGSYSAGGAVGNGYSSWIRSFAAGLNNRAAVIILEPDALPQISCLASSDQTARYGMLADAIKVLKSDASAKVYLDAGHDGWIDTATMASRLKAAGVDQADGFSLNVSNFTSTQANSAYGHAVSTLIGGKHFIIDTSRNGRAGSAGTQWCNPSRQALGVVPTTATNDPLIDAYLWIKTPGESDGACNGGPAAGTWWPDYALMLGRTAGY